MGMIVTRQPGARAASSVRAVNASFDRLIADAARIDVLSAAASTVRALLTDARIDDASLAEFAQFVPGRYARNGVYRDARFELIVMCWPAATESPIHDHGGSRGFVQVLRGTLTTESFTIAERDSNLQLARLTPSTTRTLRPGEIETTAPGDDVHRVRAGAQGAITLHLYAEPLAAFAIFDRPTDTYRQSTARYDAPPPRS